jgi:hypothetical protein
MPNNPNANAAFISIAAKLIKPDMTQSDYDKLRDVAEMLNPNKMGYVKTLNDDVEKIAPSIKRR